MEKDNFFRFAGILFLIIGITAVINTLYQNTQRDLGLASILWFSCIGMILLGIGTLKKDSSLILSQLNILGIPYIFWNIDFYYHLIKGHSLFNIADYFFIEGPLLGKIISSQHLITVPLALVLIYLIGLKRKDAWKLSFIQLIIVFFATRLVTTYEENVNCVFSNCANFDFGFWYPLQWFMAMFLLVFVTNWIVVKLFWREKRASKIY